MMRNRHPLFRPFIVVAAGYPEWQLHLSKSAYCLARVVAPLIAPVLIWVLPARRCAAVGVAAPRWHPQELKLRSAAHDPSPWA
jgi:hypothetical protein